MLEPEVEARPWDEQLALDDESYRAQLRYLLERSPFYRAKLAGADPDGGLAELATLPLTQKDELRASRTRENASSSCIRSRAATSAPCHASFCWSCTHSK